MKKTKLLILGTSLSIMPVFAVASAGCNNTENKNNNENIDPNIDPKINPNPTPEPAPSPAPSPNPAPNPNPTPNPVPTPPTPKPNPDPGTSNPKFQYIQSKPGSYDYKNFSLSQKRNWTNVLNSKLVYDKNSEYSKNYYASFEGKRGKDLFEEIYRKQKQLAAQNIQSGANGYSQLYVTYNLAFIDRYFEQDGTILDIYSEVENGKDPYKFKPGYYEGSGSLGSNPGSSSKGEGYKYNREHMIPQSWFGKDSLTRNDAHFVWPSDKKVNQDRGNDPHYWTPKGKKSKNGTKVSKNESTEPVDLFKGDTARAYFYFQITHLNAFSGKAVKVFTNVFPYFKTNYLDCYKKWAKDDQVDLAEIDRNNAIAKYQKGLRNPFIDYPELVELIWGNSNEVFHNRGVLIDLQK